MDANGKGILTSKIGLLTYDEAIHAGNYTNKGGNSYINTGEDYWLMSPAGTLGPWVVWSNGYLGDLGVRNSRISFVVISLKPDTLATGTGTEADPYIVQ